MKKIRVAVLMTVYNRKRTTIKCLDRLISQIKETNINIAVYLVDDGTDGTGILAKKIFPNLITLIEGDGHRFWCGGMRLAFSYAIRNRYDFYLWLNDDVMLYHGALCRLIDTYNDIKNGTNKECIVVGSLQDTENGMLTYGGMSADKKWWRPLKFLRLKPKNKPIKCKIFNGNCVLIPFEIGHSVGNLSSMYRHAAGDIDYGMRSIKIGYENWIAPGYIGTCPRNDVIVQNINPVGINLKINHEIVNLRVRDWITFALEYGGVWGKPYQIIGILRLKYPSIWQVVVRTIKYFYHMRKEKMSF